MCLGLRALAALPENELLFLDRAIKRAGDHSEANR